MYIVNVLRAKRKEGNSNCLYYHPLYIGLHTEHAVYYIRGNISTNSVMAELFKEFIKFMPGKKIYFEIFFLTLVNYTFKILIMMAL